MDNSSTKRKIAVPVVAGALVVIAVAVLDGFGIHVLDSPTVDAASVVVLTAIGDIALPDRFLA